VYQARWRLSGVLRAVLVLMATAMSTLLIIEWPRGIGAVRSYRRAQLVPQARPSNDFLVGIRMFPPLSGPPPATAAAADLAMADSIQPDVVLVLLEQDVLRGA